MDEESAIVFLASLYNCHQSRSQVDTPAPMRMGDGRSDMASELRAPVITGRSMASTLPVTLPIPEYEKAIADLSNSFGTYMAQMDHFFDQMNEILEECLSKNWMMNAEWMRRELESRSMDASTPVPTMNVSPAVPTALPPIPQFVLNQPQIAQDSSEPAAPMAEEGYLIGMDEDAKDEDRKLDSSMPNPVANSRDDGSTQYESTIADLSNLFDTYMARMDDFIAQMKDSLSMHRVTNAEWMRREVESRLMDASTAADQIHLADSSIRTPDPVSPPRLIDSVSPIAVSKGSSNVRRKGKLKRSRRDSNQTDDGYDAEDEAEGDSHNSPKRRRINKKQSDRE